MQGLRTASGRREAGSPPAYITSGNANDDTEVAVFDRPTAQPAETATVAVAFRSASSIKLTGISDR